MNDPLLSYLGLCRRAGRLSAGFEAAAEAIKRKQSRLILLASDLSAKTEKELRFLCRDMDIKVVRIDKDLLTISKAIGVKAGAVSVNDDGFAGAMLAHCSMNGEELPI